LYFTNFFYNIFLRILQYFKRNKQFIVYSLCEFYRCFPQIVDAVRTKSESVDAVRQQLGSVNTMSGQFEIVNAVRTKSKDSFTLSRKILPWTHYRELIRVENPIVRKWYEQEALREMWSTHTLHRNIASQYYNRLLQSAYKDKVVDEMHRLTAPMQQDKLEFIKNDCFQQQAGFYFNERAMPNNINYTSTHQPFTNYYYLCIVKILKPKD